MHQTVADGADFQHSLWGGFSMSSDDLVQRMNDLETRLAFQDDTVQALNDVVSKQELELERLQRAVELLARRQADLAAALPGEADEGQPPRHYCAMAGGGGARPAAAVPILTRGVVRPRPAGPSPGVRRRARRAGRVRGPGGLRRGWGGSGRRRRHPAPGKWSRSPCWC